MTAYTMQNAHHEIALEQHLVDRLIATQGYISRKPEDYDRPLAVDRELVLQFLKETQPGEWQKLEAQYHDRSRGRVLQATGEGPEDPRHARRAAATASS